MKSLTILLALVFTVMFSSTSFAEWKKFAEDVDGAIYYVDLETIRKHDEYLYLWELRDNLKPDKDGIWSLKVYRQVDCKFSRFKLLSGVWHPEPMGGGTGETYNPKNPEWRYPPPDAVNGILLKSVCEYAN